MVFISGVRLVPTGKFIHNSYVQGQTVSFALAIYALMYVRVLHAHRDLDRLSHASDGLTTRFHDSL